MNSIRKPAKKYQKRNNKKLESIKNSLNIFVSQYNKNISDKYKSLNIWDYINSELNELDPDVSKILKDVLNRGNINDKDVDEVIKFIENKKLGENYILDINLKIFQKILDTYIDKILNINTLPKDEIVEVIIFSEYLAEVHYCDISSSKFRDFYNYILTKSSGDKWFLNFALLEPKIAYHFGKESNENKKLALKKLWYFISTVIKKIKETNSKNDDNGINKFKSFKIFFEAVVAYHKIYAKSQ